ncbi:zinc dependent phospholipase C family protein [Carnobacteriaceae bacterium zg-C25]|nr:zinc dependent phospholipase C family protein [Carnobacteriaceae bacterium zg-C25]
MASIYTHNRFGKHVKHHFPKEWQKAIVQNESLYLLGQQGPDLFFFYPKTLMKSDSPGTVIHKQAGKQFINNQKDRLRALPLNHPQWSYFIGSLCHYILDVHIHPTVEAVKNDATGYSHIAVETELDRYYIEQDGMVGVEYRLDKLITKDDVTYEQHIPPFYNVYDKADQKTVMGGIRYFRLVKKWCFAKTPLREKIVAKLIKVIGNDTPNFNGLVMHLTPLPEAQQNQGRLVSCVDKALEAAPTLIQNAIDFIREDVPLVDFFNYTYDGDYVNEQ